MAEVRADRRLGSGSVNNWYCAKISDTHIGIVAWDNQRIHLLLFYVQFSSPKLLVCDRVIEVGMINFK